MTIKNDLVSIIIPVYNVESYICECLDSIIKQTYLNLEILLIDDGSLDSSLKICQEYLKKDNRIKLFTIKNNGLSNARNYGLDRVNGDWIFFVDSDDRIQTTCIETLLLYAKRNTADLVIGNINILKDGVTIPSDWNHSGYRIEDGKSYLAQALKNSYKLPVLDVIAWNKLYSKSLFAEARYKKDIIHEDEEILLKIMTKAQRVMWIPEIIYDYRQRTDSIMGKRISTRRLDILIAYQDRIKYIKKNKICSFTNIELDKIYYSYVNICRQAFKSEKHQVDFKYKKILLNLYPKYLIYSKTNFKEKILVLIFILFPGKILDFYKRN